MSRRSVWGALVGGVLLVGSVLPWTAPAVAAPGADIIVSAHRGGSAYAPENTLPAFENAVRLGVDELEADVQLTSDGHLVVLHDDTLDRTTDCVGAVLDQTLMQVRQCDAGHWWSPGPSQTVRTVSAPHPLRGKGIQVPTVEELLAVGRRTGAPKLSIEVKNIPGEANFDPAGVTVATALIGALRASGIDLAKVTVQSFFPTSLEAVKRLEPSLRTQFLTSSGTGQTASQNFTYTTTRDIDVMAPNDNAPDLSAELIQAAQAAGREVFVYTPDSRSALQRALEWGVDGAITDRPACLLQLLGRPVPSGTTGGVAACESEPAALTEGAPQDRPAPETCRALRPPRWEPTTGPQDPRGDLRVVGLQYKQDIDNVVDYAAFRTAMRCLVEDHVVDRLDGRPMLAVFNEDIGLMTLATGSRGASLRTLAASPARAPAGSAAPIGAAAALGLANASYAPQSAAYQAMFGPVDPRKQVLLAATDTFARAFSQTFSDIARDYGIYVVAGNNQASFRATTDPAEIALFADPDLPAPAEAYVATSGRVPNVAFVWGPDDVDPQAPRPERNLVHRNEKVPLTQTELDLLALDNGPSTGQEAIDNVTGPELASHRLGIATSLPAFQYGYPFGKRPADLEPCADTTISYMACMDAQGVDVVVQDEANPGPWAAYNPGGWQPLEWNSSTWRAAADPTVNFTYNITPHLVGNLLDLPFDGQSAITVRGGGQPARHYVGTAEPLDARDPPEYQVYAGNKPHFLALAPWVVPDAPRTELQDVSARLAGGSGDEIEDGYLQTAVAADLLPRGSVVAPPVVDGGSPAASASPVTGAPVVAGGPPASRLPATGGAPPYAALVLLLLVLTYRRHRCT